MKRSQRFSNSLSFGEDQQLQPQNEDGEGQSTQSESDRVSASTELVEEQSDSILCDSPFSRSVLLRPQELWIRMTKCLTLRWPSRLSINRQSSRKFAFQVDLDQSMNTDTSDSSDSTNESSSKASPADDRSLPTVKQGKEDMRTRGIKSGPPTLRGVSHSSPRLPRARQASDSLSALMVLDKEMFLRVELIDTGEEREDLRYRAEWKLSEKTKELAEGVWLSKSQNMMH